MPLLSASPADASPRTPEEPKNVHQLETPGKKERSVFDLKNGSRSTNRSSGATTLIEKSESLEVGERVETVISAGAAETITYSLESDANTEATDSIVKQTHYTVPRPVVVTQVEAEEQNGTSVQKAAYSATANEATVQDVSTLSAQNSIHDHQRYEAGSVTEAFSFASNGGGTRRTVTLASRSARSSIGKQLLEMERLHEQEKEHIIAVMTEEHEEYKLIFEEEIYGFKTEQERLVREISSSASRISQLEDQLSSTAVVVSQDKSHSIIGIITTTITSITTTITTITTRVEKWKQTVSRNNGQLTITSKELEQLFLDVSNTNSQITDLQQHYAVLSRDFNSVRHQLQVTLSLRDAKDRSITSLTKEVTQWKNADAEKTQQIKAARRESDKLRRELNVASSGRAEIKQRYDAQERQLISVRDEGQRKTLLLEERDRTIASLKAEVARWKTSDAKRAQQIESDRQENKNLQKKLAATCSQLEELRKRYDVQSKEFVSVQTELGASKSVVQEQRGSITTLTAEVEQWKRADATLTEKFAVEHQEKEKLQQDLKLFSTRIDDLQKQYNAQSQVIVSIRNDLQIKVSLLEKKEVTINSLTTEVTQAKSGVNLKVEQLRIAQESVEQLRLELSSATTRSAELLVRCETQSKEIYCIRDELHRIEILYPDGKNKAPVNPSAHAVSQHIARALEEKNKQMEELRRDLTTSNARNIELQKSYEKVSREVSKAREVLKVTTSQSEITITSLTKQVHHLKSTDDAKATEIASNRKQLEKFTRDLSDSTTELTKFHDLYEKETRKLADAKKQLHVLTTSVEEKNRTVASLTAKVTHLMEVDYSNAEQITASKTLIQKLQGEVTIIGSKLAEVQGRCDAQLHELESARNDLLSKTASCEEQVHIVVSLTAQVEEWKRTDELKEERIVTIRKRVMDLEQDLTISKTEIITVQQRYDEQSKEFISIQSQVEEWKRSDTTKTEQLVIARKEIEQLDELKRVVTTQTEELDVVRKKLEVSGVSREKLEKIQIDLSISSSRVTELQQLYKTQTTELISVRKQLEATLTLDGGKDIRVVALNEQIEQWKRSDAAKVEDLTRARSDIAQLQSRLSVSTIQIEGLHQYYAEQIEIVKTSSSTVSEESRKVYQKMTTEVKDYGAVIKLTATFDEWLRADAKRAEELAVELEKRRKENEELRERLITLKEIYVRAPELKQIFQSETVEIRQRHDEQSTAVTSATVVEQSSQSTVVEQSSQSSGVQLFVTPAATHTDTAIVQVLQKLDTEIQQTATSMAERLIKDFRPRAAHATLTQEQSSAVHRVSASIGQNLVGFLGKKDRQEVAVFLPFAFQAYIAYHLRPLISSWTSGKECNELIEKTYEQLQKSEAQAIAGRWRSLTRTYISPACLSDPKTLVSTIVSGLADIAVAAGCAASFSAAKSKISSQFGEKVTSIISVAGELSKIIGEVVSADFEVYSVRPLHAFEETTMEDVHGSGKKQGATTGQQVLCATQLGMTKRTQLESGKSESSTVVKAKVVLEAFVERHQD